MIKKRVKRKSVRKVTITSNTRKMLTLLVEKLVNSALSEITDKFELEINSRFGKIENAVNRIEDVSKSVTGSYAQLLQEIRTINFRGSPDYQKWIKEARGDEGLIIPDGRAK